MAISIGVALECLFLCFLRALLRTSHVKRDTFSNVSAFINVKLHRLILHYAKTLQLFKYEANILQIFIVG